VAVVVTDDSGLPSGFVTFVFTDIEGSTRLLRELKDRYAEVLHLYRSVLRSVWRTYGGVEVNTAGDGCLVAFASQATAIVAATAAQTALREVLWPTPARPLVRIALHGGPAVPCRGDYPALAVHQGYRLMTATRGDQVLVSEVGAEVGSPDDIELVPLGAFWLRDFAAPVWLYQAEDRPAKAPPLMPRAVPASGVTTIRRGRTRVHIMARRRHRPRLAAATM
jgi:class 3 adenylate cyclase